MTHHLKNGAEPTPKPSCTVGMSNSLSTTGCLKKDATVPGAITCVGKITTA